MDRGDPRGRPDQRTRTGDVGMTQSHRPPDRVRIWTAFCTRLHYCGLCTRERGRINMCRCAGLQQRLHICPVCTTLCALPLYRDVAWGSFESAAVLQLHIADGEALPRLLLGELSAEISARMVSQEFPSPATICECGTRKKGKAVTTSRSGLREDTSVLKADKYRDVE
ncbi:hypothetical protein MRX96_029215 [Rhipicephalus microplus]